MDKAQLQIRAELCNCGGSKGYATSSSLTAEIAKPAAAEKRVKPLLAFVQPTVEQEKRRDISGEARLTFIVNRWDIHLPATLFASQSGGEDWQGLDSLVRLDPAVPGRQDVMQLLATEQDAQQRKTRLAALDGGRSYSYMLTNIYSQLRRVRVYIYYIVKNFSLEEAREVFREHPHNLSLNEMYQLALSYPEGSQDFVDIFETAVRLFPHDPTANLNAAVAAQTIERLSAENAFCMTSRRQINTVLDGVDEATVNGQNTPDATKHVFSFDLERIVSQAVVSKASSLVATTTDVANSRVTVDLDNLNYAVINGATSVNFWLDNAGDRTITDVGAGTMKYNGLKSAIHDYLGDISDDWNNAKTQNKADAKLIRLGNYAPFTASVLNTDKATRTAERNDRNAELGGYAPIPA